MFCFFKLLITSNFNSSSFNLALVKESYTEYFTSTPLDRQIYHSMELQATAKESRFNFKEEMLEGLNHIRRLIFLCLAANTPKLGGSSYKQTTDPFNSLVKKLFQVLKLSDIMRRY